MLIWLINAFCQQWHKHMAIDQFYAQEKVNSSLSWARYGNNNKRSYLPQKEGLKMCESWHFSYHLQKCHQWTRLDSKIQCLISKPPLPPVYLRQHGTYSLNIVTSAFPYTFPRNLPFSSLILPLSDMKSTG